MDPEDLFDGLRSAGEADEGGAFTLDFERARQQIAGHLLPEPRLYALKMVQSAVAAGAVRMTVEPGLCRLRCYHDGRLPTREELEQLPALLLPGSSSRADLQALGVAVVTALHHRGASVTVTAWDGEDAVQLRVRQGEARTERLGMNPYYLGLAGPPRSRGVVFEVRRPLGWDGVVGPREDARLVAERTKYAPLRVAVGGTGVSLQPFGGAPVALAFGPSWPYVTCQGRYYETTFHLAEARFEAEEGGPVIGLPAEIRAASAWHGHWTGDAPLQQRVASIAGALQVCAGALAYRAHLGMAPEVVLVCRGVTVARVTDVSLPSGLYAVVGIPDEGCDLTGLAARDAEITRCVAACRRHADVLLRAALRDAPKATVRQQFAWLLCGDAREDLFKE